MTAQGTIRTDVEERLVDKIAALPGFSTTADDDGSWWVTPPPNDVVTNKRWMVIGAYTGQVDPEAMAAGHGPQLDQWTIGCAAAVHGVDDPFGAKREVEAAYNAVANMLAADHRLTMAGAPVLGCQDVQPARLDGPNFSVDDKGEPVAWVEFDIAVAAPVVRNISG